MPPVDHLPAIPCPTSRREFLGLSAGALAAGLAVRPAGVSAAAREIRIGLIGCGGRGTGAAVQAAAADPGVRIVALGDLFADQLASAAHVLARDAGPQFACPAARRFNGADAHRRVLDAGVDAVLIAAPPHLRPRHVEEAVAAGVHLFCETPAAIDAEGAMRVARALDLARAAGLTVASGLHARRDEALAAVVDEVRAGGIGHAYRVDVQATLNAPWTVAAQPGWSSAEVRLRNWVSDDSLSGGRFVERHVHAIDRALWVLGDRTPDVAEPLPMRAGDGIAVRYRFADGAEIQAMAMRQAEATATRRDVAMGSRGMRELTLAADGRRFQSTMDAFLRSIRSGHEMDESGILVRATLVAIMGRAAALSGRAVRWEEMPAADRLAFPVHQIGTDVNLAGV